MRISGMRSMLASGRRPSLEVVWRSGGDCRLGQDRPPPYPADRKVWLFPYRILASRRLRSHCLLPDHFDMATAGSTLTRERFVTVRDGVRLSVRDQAPSDVEATVV